MAKNNQNRGGQNRGQGGQPKATETNIGSGSEDRQPLTTEQEKAVQELLGSDVDTSDTASVVEGLIAEVQAAKESSDEDVSNNTSGEGTGRDIRDSAIGEEPEKELLEEQQPDEDDEEQGSGEDDEEQGSGEDDEDFEEKNPPSARKAEQAKQVEHMEQVLAGITKHENLKPLELIEFVIDHALNNEVLPKDIRDAMNKKLAGKSSRQGGKGGTVTLLNSDFDGAKIATQAKGILTCLAENGGEMSQEQLIEELSGYIKTVQTPQRILQFYRKQLIDGGFIEIT